MTWRNKRKHQKETKMMKGRKKGREIYVTVLLLTSIILTNNKMQERSGGLASAFLSVMCTTFFFFFLGQKYQHFYTWEKLV